MSSFLIKLRVSECWTSRMNLWVKYVFIIIISRSVASYNYHRHYWIPNGTEYLNNLLETYMCVLYIYILLFLNKALKLQCNIFFKPSIIHNIFCTNKLLWSMWMVRWFQMRKHIQIKKIPEVELKEWQMNEWLVCTYIHDRDFNCDSCFKIDLYIAVHLPLPCFFCKKMYFSPKAYKNKK